MYRAPNLLNDDGSASCDRVWGRLAVGATRTPIPDA